MQNPKKHHYIPQFYLQNFINNESNKLYVYNKKTNKSYGKQSPKNTCNENNYFSLGNDNDFNNSNDLKQNLNAFYQSYWNIDFKKQNIASYLESMLSKIESNVAYILSKIIRHNSIAYFNNCRINNILTPDDFKILIEWIAWIYISNPNHKDFIKNNFLTPNASNLDIINESINLHPQVSDDFLKQNWFLHNINSDNFPVFTTNNPVTLLDANLQSPIYSRDITNIYIPLSPTLFLYGKNTTTNLTFKEFFDSYLTTMTKTNSQLIITNTENNLKTLLHINQTIQLNK